MIPGKEISKWKDEQLAEKLKPLGFKSHVNANGIFWSVPAGEYFDFSKYEPEAVVFWATKTIFFKGVEVGEAKKAKEIRNLICIP